MEMLLESVAPDSGRGMSHEVHEIRAFEATPRSAGEARHWIREILRDAAVPDEQMYSLELLASELIANSVIHTPATVVTVRVSLVDDSVSVSVRDPGSCRRTSACLPDPDIGGRGLAIVANVSSSWGIKSVPGGKEMWFRLDWPRQQVETPAEGMAGPAGRVAGHIPADRRLPGRDF